MLDVVLRKRDCGSGYTDETKQPTLCSSFVVDYMENLHATRNLIGRLRLTPDRIRLQVSLEPTEGAMQIRLARIGNYLHWQDASGDIELNGWHDTYRHMEVLLEAAGFFNDVCEGEPFTAYVKITEVKTT